MAKSKKARGPSPRMRAELEKLPKMSETILEFAKPLLDAMATDPPTLEEMQLVMMLAGLTWNFPLQCDRRRTGEGAATIRRMFEDAIPKIPPELRHLLDELMHTRVTKYAHDPRIATVDVVEERSGHARVSATSFLLPDLPYDQVPARRKAR